MERTIEQIQQEYQQGALKAGHISYQVYALKKDLELVNQALQNLNLEAAALKAKQVEEKKEVKDA